MKLAVVGTRTYQNKNRVYFEINEFRKAHSVTEIVSGDGKTGPDKFAKEYAEDYKLKYKGFPADWTDMSEPCFKKKGQNGEYNALAGFKRNTEIAEYADKMLVFWDSKSPGTNDVKTKMEKLKKSVKTIKI